MDFIKESCNDEMKQKYDEYLTSHISNVQKGFKYLCDKHIIELDLIKATFPKIEEQIRNHDQSKYSKEEYEPYVEYFYGEKDEKGEVYPYVQDKFDEAWNHHQKRNPHHWQYWLLREDEGKFKAIHMDYNYIIEMVCDWWAFSWKQNNLYEIFNWYEENKPKMQMHKNTVRDLEELLKDIKIQLDLDKSEGDYSSKDLNESIAQFFLLDKNEKKYVDFINKQTKFGYIDSSGNYHTKSYGTDSVVFSADEFEKNKTGSCLVRAIYLKEKLKNGKIIAILDRKNKFGHFVFVNNDNIAIDPKYGSFTAASDEAIKNFYKINNPDFIGEVNTDTLIGVKYSDLWDTILGKTNNLNESFKNKEIIHLNENISKTTNRIFITGITASGKTHYAKEYFNKEEIIELDKFDIKNNSDNYNKTRKSLVVNEFLKEYKLTNDSDKNIKTFIEWILRQNIQHLVIIEGIHIIDFPELLKNEEVIVLNSSLETIIQNYKTRLKKHNMIYKDVTIDDKTPKDEEEFIKILTQHYNKENKKIHNFIKIFNIKSADYLEESIRNESEDTFILNAMEHVLDVFDSNACDMAMRGLKRKFEKKFNLTEEEWERYDKVAMKRWYIKNYGEERWKRYVDSIKQDLDTDIEPQEEDNDTFFDECVIYLINKVINESDSEMIDILLSQIKEEFNFTDREFYYYEREALRMYNKDQSILENIIYESNRNRMNYLMKLDADKREAILNSDNPKFNKFKKAYEKYKQNKKYMTGKALGHAIKAYEENKNAHDILFQDTKTQHYLNKYKEIKKASDIINISDNDLSYNKKDQNRFKEVTLTHGAKDINNQLTFHIPNNHYERFLNNRESDLNSKEFDSDKNPDKNTGFVIDTIVSSIDKKKRK